MKAPRFVQLALQLIHAVPQPEVHDCAWCNECAMDPLSGLPPQDRGTLVATLADGGSCREGNGAGRRRRRDAGVCRGQRLYTTACNIFTIPFIRGAGVAR